MCRHKFAQDFTLKTFCDSQLTVKYRAFPSVISSLAIYLLAWLHSSFYDLNNINLFFGHSNITSKGLNWIWHLSLIGILLRWGFLIWELIFIYCGLFVLILVVFVLFRLLLRFGQISPLAFFRWFTATPDRNAESFNRIPSNYCLP